MSVLNELLEQWLIPTELYEFPINVLGIKWGSIGHLIVEFCLDDAHKFWVEFADECDVDVGDIKFGDLVSQ